MYTGEFPKRMGREGGGLGYPNTHYANFGSCHVTFHLTFFLLEPIKLLLHYIRSAIKDPNHRYIGFQLSELIEGLQLIVLNDTNKATVSNGINFLINLFRSHHSRGNTL